MPKGLQRRCPICGKLVEWSGNKFRPFCSKRCKIIDLGEWSTNAYRIPGKKLDDDELEKEMVEKVGENEEEKKK